MGGASASHHHPPAERERERERETERERERERERGVRGFRKPVWEGQTGSTGFLKAAWRRRPAGSLSEASIGPVTMTTRRCHCSRHDYPAAVAEDNAHV